MQGPEGRHDVQYKGRRDNRVQGYLYELQSLDRSPFGDPAEDARNDYLNLRIFQENIIGN